MLYFCSVGHLLLPKRNDFWQHNITLHVFFQYYYTDEKKAPQTNGEPLTQGFLAYSKIITAKAV
jgi:hypothetical protein